MMKRPTRLFACLNLAFASAAPGFLAFPPGFLWGASTASHQVEGNTTNDWTVWETANATRLASTAQQRLGSLASWNDIKAQATDPANYVSGAAADDYDRYRQDIDLAKSLGLTSYRFSLEWSRIEPAEGRFDAAAIAHYRDEIRYVKAAGMQPFVTVWHWTNPVWFANQGGWLGSKAVQQFDAYSEKVSDELGGEATFWITVNEPEVYAGSSYLTGEWTPQHKSVFDYFHVLDNLAQAHKDAYASLHAANPSAQVGIAHPHTYFDANGTWWGAIAKAVADYWYDYYFLDKITGQEDYIGVNFYKRQDVSGTATLTGKVSDMGWELYPQGIYYALTEVGNRYHKPIYVTENGLADASDSQRSGYVTEIARNIHQAINDGADVRGYSYWSLLDNFEWAEGKWPRFGLVSVDYATQERTVRKSAWDYAAIARQNGVAQ